MMSPSNPTHPSARAGSARRVAKNRPWTAIPRRMRTWFGAWTTACLVLGCSAEPADTASGGLEVQLLFDPAAKVGQNEAEIRVKDAEGVAVSGAVVTVEPMMPMHGHGSTEAAVVTDSGDGSYVAFPVTLQMAGAWTITVRATKGALSGETKVDVNL